MSKTFEEVAKGVQVFLQANLAAALGEVEAFWADDPINLAEPETWLLGVDLVDYVLAYESEEFPIVSVMALTRGPETPMADQWGYQDVGMMVVVDFAIVHTVLATTAKYAWRYAWALRKVLQSQRKVAMSQLNYEQNIQLSNVERTTDEDASPEDVFYVQVGRVEVPMA